MTRVLDRFISATVLKDHEMVVGLIDVPGAARRVATWDGLESRHMSAAAARRLAESLMEGEAAVALRPVAEALLDKADAADDWGRPKGRPAYELSAGNGERIRVGDETVVDAADLFGEPARDARAGFTGNLPDLSAGT